VCEVDIVVWYGGEEFVVVIFEIDIEGVEWFVVWICEVVCEDLFVVGEDSVDVMVLVGIVLLLMYGLVSGDFVWVVDEGLYVVKCGGCD